MEVELTRISEKGQIVIPASLRKEMGIEKSDQFLIFGENSTIVLKKVEKAAMQKSFDELTKPLHKAIAESGLTREDLKQVIKDVRKKNA